MYVYMYAVNKKSTVNKAKERVLVFLTASAPESTYH